MRKDSPHKILKLHLIITVSHDSPVSEGMNLTICPPRGPGSTPGHGEVFQGIFPWLITRVALYTVWEDLKARPTAETVAESGVAPPCEKLLPISNDSPQQAVNRRNTNGPRLSIVS